MSDKKLTVETPGNQDKRIGVHGTETQLMGHILRKTANLVQGKKICKKQKVSSNGNQPTTCPSN